MKPERDLLLASMYALDFL